MKKQTFTAIALLAVATATVRAQTDGDLSKQLEVTRAYTPRVGQATKLAIEPDMTDTVRLRPEISYRITSTASATSFETRPFEAATISAAPFEVRKPFYVRAGVGVPFGTGFDLYYSPRTKTGSTFGLFANHSGSYSKITNDLGVKANATEMSNGAGMWVTRRWKRYSLETDLTYDHRVYEPYGAAGLDPDPASSALYSRNFTYDRYFDRITLGKARAGVSFGDNFTNLNRFNFRVGLDGGYAHGSDQADLDVRVTAARMFGAGKHGFELVLAERGAFDGAKSDGLTKADAVTVTFAPRYLLSAGNLSLRAGVDVRYIANKMYDQDRLGFAPSLEARANLAGGAFVPFVSYTSRIVDGSREALSRRNPYTRGSGTTAWVDDARIGFSGDLGDLFSYKIAGGVSMFDDYQLFVGAQDVMLRQGSGDATGLDYPPMWFEPLPVNGARFTAGAELALHNLGGFGARLYGNWNKFDFSGKYIFEFDPAGDLPNYDAGAELSYRHKDIFALRFGVEFMGERNYMVRSGARYTTGSLSPVFDLTFGADVKVARDFWVFLEGENLANQTLYPYPHYKGLGASLLGGIKVVF